jgi:energy-coupling factor transport system permease protein
MANALVTRTGSTVLVDGWTVPVFGKLDITLEATVYGVLLGMRAMIVIGCGALLSAAIDSDELLRAFRRLGFRSALTAALATRMFGVLRRDAHRLHLAQKSRGAAAASSLQLVRAVLSGALDRSVDVAATLEVRGYGAARRAPRGVSRPWSRHDASFALAAAALVAKAVSAAAGSWEDFEAYPRLAAEVDTGTIALAGALAVAALLPFADRRGVAAP